MFLRTPSEILVFISLIQNEKSHKIKGPNGTRIQSKGVYKHTFDQSICHNENKLLWKHKILGDCRITTIKFRRSTDEQAG